MKIRPDRRWWALLALLMLVAHASLFGVGPVGEDFAVLARLSHAVFPAEGASGLTLDFLFTSADGAERPLATSSLALSTWIWTSDGQWTTFALAALRFENIAILCAVAWALGCFLRRLVSPWAGAEQAMAAGQAAIMLLVVHPLAVTAIASPLARGDLLGAFFALLASVAFLRGRQEHSYWLVFCTAPLVALSCLASELGYLVPLGLACAEYISSRRYRPVPVRVRTAITTAICFGACASFDVGLRLALGFEAWPQEILASLLTLTSFGDLWVSLLSGLTKLGVLILPVNGANAGGGGFVLAALILVLVIQPALHAGKSAPRFWITALCIWLASMLLTEAVRAGLRVGPNDFSDVAGLLPAVVVMVMGLALASTAVSGGRRQALPVIVACLLCVLARNNARGWRSAAKNASKLREQALPLVLSASARSSFLVVDAPGLVDLFAACPDEMAWMFGAAHGGQLHGEGVHSEGGLNIRALSREALMSYSRLDEFDALREFGVTVILPLEYLQPWAENRWVAQRMESSNAAARALSWNHFPPNHASQAHDLGASHWSAAEGRALGFADPSGVECLTVGTEAQSESASAESEALLADPEIYWRAQGGLVRGGELRGVWLREGDHRTAVFDPGSDLDWLLGHQVDSLLLMGELAQTQGADVWDRPPLVPSLSEPAVDGDDWHLGRPGGGEYSKPGVQEGWFLTLLDLASLELEVIECAFDSRGDLIAPDAEEISQSLRQEPGSLAWSVERRVSGLVIERCTGRF